MKGHEGVVRHLINAKARINPDAGNGRVPLDDALANGHSGTLKLLVEGCADLFRPLGTPSLLGAPKRCIDNLFESSNPVLVCSAAAGLRGAVQTMANMKDHDLLKFLTYPGESPMLIMQAIFQPVQIEHWEMKEERKARSKINSAFLENVNGMNVALGPDQKYLRQLFVKKKVLEGNLLSFLYTVAPQQPRYHKDVLVPVDFFVCVLPSVQ